MSNARLGLFRRGAAALTAFLLAIMTIFSCVGLAEDAGTEETPETAEAEPVPEQELPDISKALLIALPAVWVLIGLYTVWEKKKNKRKN